jgi:hypothetical protein
VVLGGEHQNPNNTGGAFYSVTYGGVALTEAVQEEARVPTLAIFYLDNPEPAGDIVVNQASHNGSLYTIYQLAGTAAGVGATNKANTNSVSLTITASSSIIIIAGILDTGADGGNGAPKLTADAPLTEDTLTDLEAGSRCVSMSTGRATLATPGIGNYSFLNAGGSDILAIVAVEFLTGSTTADTAPPTLVATDIVDDQGGTNTSAGTLVTYTATISEDINETTLEAGEFANAGS